MWGALLSLPILVGITLAIVQRVPSRRVRRSLQFAVLCSLAVHLLMMLGAAFYQIFPSSNFERQTTTTPQRTERVMFVQRQREVFPWQNTREALPVEKEIEQPQPVSEQPQPLSHTQPQPAASNQSARSEMSRREPTQGSTPALAENLSERKRSEVGTSPASGASQLSKTEPKTSTPRPTLDAAPLPANRQSAVESASAREIQAPQPTSPHSATASAATRASNMNSEISATASPETSARIRNRETEIAQSTKASGETSAPSAKNALPTAVESATAATSEPSQRSATKPLSTSTLATAPDMSIPNPSTRPLTSQRREQEANTSSLAALDREPRPVRSTTETSVQPSSPLSLESPAPTSSPLNSATTKPQMAETSPTRGEQNSALARNNRNLSPESQSSSGAAPAPSTAARRRDATQAAQAPESLTAQTASPNRRSVANEKAPSTAQQVNTTSAAKMRGERIPESKTAESSAALHSSALPNATQRLSAEIGDSLLDTGAIKSVAESQPERAIVSGGGNPQIGPLPEPQARPTDRAASGQTPTLDAKAVAATAASESGSSRSSNAAPANSAETLNESTRLASSTNDNPNRVSPSPAPSSGESSNHRISSGSSLERRDDRNEATAKAVGETGTESLAGTARTALSRAPTTSATIQPADSTNRPGNTSDSARSSARESSDPSSERQVASLQATGPSGSSAAPTANPITAGSGELKRAMDSGNDNALSARRESPTDTSRGRLDRGLASPSTSNTTSGSETLPTVGRGESTAASTANLPDTRLASSARSQVDAPVGPAGLGQKPSLDAGIPDRPASRESNLLLMETDQRFKRDDTKSTPQTRTDVASAVEPFRSRESASGGGPTTEPAIELGLQFLARHQRSDGSWSLGGFDQDVPRMAHQFESDTAATGLSLLAFQGAGYTHREYKYAAQIERGLRWLVDHQSPDGCLYVESDPESNKNARLYSHAIAALVLTEAYGMTRDPELREPCLKALAYIEQSQDSTLGGWRYFAELKERRTDTSVTGWMLMALQSGRLAGLPTQEVTWQRIDRWLEMARDPVQEGRFRYDPFAPDHQRQQQQATPSMTGVGLLMRLYMGWEARDPRTLAAADYLLKSPPGMDSIEQRDTYHWYYATQVLRHVGDQRWTEWNSRLHPLLVQSQVKSGDMAGSWHPYEPVPDRWGLVAGRLYVTTMNLLSLEVDYRLLPLYR
jgi:hypothetical protein